MDEPAAMDRAFSLAWAGWGRAQPNPLVGAVLLRDGAVVGEGYHAEFGGPHAEVAAIDAAGDRARGASLVVTLEPCRHEGKQPPCVDAIVRAGIRRVVIAAADPDRRAGGGAAVLASAGIEVAWLRHPLACAQNAPFFHRARESARPWVALKLATSLDGRIADRDGRSRWISGPEAREYVHWLRAGFDAIGIGGRTASVDDASLTVRGAVEPRVAPVRVVFDRSLSVSVASTLARTARDTRTLIVTDPDNLPAASRLAALGVEIVPAADLIEALIALRTAGIGSLLVEGGGHLAGALIAAAAVDRFHWIQSPLFLGEGVSAVSGLPSVSLASAERWTVVERRALGADTLLVVDREPCSQES